jgi:hypothetical protein
MVHGVKDEEVVKKPGHDEAAWEEGGKFSVGS